MRWLALLALLAAAPAFAAPTFAAPAPERAAALARGVNITNWLRFPARADAASIGAYLSDAAMADLRRSGFTFVRVPFDPAFATTAAGRGLIVSQLRRLQSAGLAVVPVPASSVWKLEERAADRDELLDTWRRLAPALRRLDPDLVFPEIVNEPVFAGAADSWAALQARALGVIRAALPSSTVILTGADWSSIGGLAALPPTADANVAYDFHFYDPTELTSLAAYRSGLDRAALARLPFPVKDAADCARTAAASDQETKALIGFVCAMHWNGRADQQPHRPGRRPCGDHHVVVIAGEFGASARLNEPARLAWIEAVRRACEEQGIGWALWGYDDVMGFDLPHPPGRHPILDPALLVALGLPGAPTGARKGPLPQTGAADKSTGRLHVREIRDPRAPPGPTGPARLVSAKAETNRRNK